MPKYKLMRGVHSQGGVIYESAPDGSCIVESENDLLKHNTPGSQPRFVLVDETPPKPAVSAAPKKFVRKVRTAKKSDT